MEIIENTPERLSFRDEQSDKRIGLMFISIFLAVVGFIFAREGGYGIAAIFLLPAIVCFLLSRRPQPVTTTVFDRATNQVQQITEHRGERSEKTLSLDDIAKADISRRGDIEAGDGGFDQPVLVLHDGTVWPLREYHSAGTQSQAAVDAIEAFLKRAP